MRMGVVPPLFRYFCRRVPNAFVSNVPGHIDELYIDLNGAVHGAVCELTAGNQVVTDDSVIRTSIGYIELMIDRFRPRGLVYVAVDGVPPRAKTMQQRWHRFRHIHRGTHSSWDTNAITPGTPFMRSLDAALDAWASDNRAIISPSTDAGEGKQKIFAYMRESEYSRGGATVVCGMDTDLVLMSMAEYDGYDGVSTRMFVVREQQKQQDYSVIDIRALVAGVKAHLMQGSGDIADFLALVTLAGNDVVPPLPGISIVRGGVDHLLRLYQEEKRSPDERLWGVGGSALMGGLNPSFLQRILYRNARTEALSLNKQQQQQQQQQQSFALNVDAVRPMDSGWRSRYYVQAFGCSESEFVLDISRRYVSMVAWSASYMIGRACLSRGAICEHGHAAPLALDIAHAINDEIDLFCRDMYKATEVDYDSGLDMGMTASDWHLLQVLPAPPASMGVAGAMYPTWCASAELLPPLDLMLLSVSKCKE